MFLFPEITLLNTKLCIIMEEAAAEQGTCSFYFWTLSKALPLHIPWLKVINSLGRNVLISTKK